MGNDLAKILCQGAAQPVRDSCRYCFDDCSCQSSCDRWCPCSCTVTTHAHKDSEELDDEESKGEG